MSKHWYDKPRTIEIGVSSVGAGSTTEVPVFAAPFRCKIRKASIIPKSSITGASTNNMTLGFKNKGTDGSGTDVIAYLQFASGINASSFVEKDLGAVTANVLTQGAVVSFYKAESGTGMAMPDLVAKLEIERI